MYMLYMYLYGIWCEVRPQSVGYQPFVALGYGLEVSLYIDSL